MSIKRLIFISFLMFFSSVLGQNIIVNINGSMLKNKDIRLYYIADGISMNQILVQKFLTTDQTTNIQVKTTIEGTKEFILKSNLREFHFIGSAGNIYTINIEDYEDSVSNFAIKYTLPATLKVEKNEDLGILITDIDTEIGNFLFENERLLSIKDSQEIKNLTNLEQNLLQKYKQNDYLITYIKYEFAAIYYGFNIESRKKIKQKYFKDATIQYDNIGYMECFATIFSHYFSQGYKFISKNDIEQYLDAGNLKAFDDALGRDNTLENETFRELVFLQGMKDAYLEGYFYRPSVLNMLKIFTKSTKFARHKEIANNLITKLSSMGFSSKNVKDFIVTTTEGEKVNISSFLDKPLIVCLVQLDCISCLKELETINFFYDSIKDNVNILVLCFDNSFESMYNFVKNSKVGSRYKFPFAYFDKNFELVEQYKLHFFPTFLLIGTDGVIIENPMRSPSEGCLNKYINKK